ncbi:glutamine amidotransferase [Rhodococcus erythropolis]|uniref:Glutamine amidotransferase n=1 Tax=Rhodococcus erythropolis TaxID=1833 RepID=A0A6G9CUV0_RHOER|nr:glutamine amidotransferase [Rhodococcus erythropolis]
MAYSGEPILAHDLLFRPQHSLIDQSLHSQLGATTTNGDGFGIGWYGEGPQPAVFKSIEPAWNDSNLREVTSQLRTPLLFAHIRASTGTAVQRSNCHPFRHRQWLWMHNGSLHGFHDMKRELVTAIDPSLFPDLEGSTDSETLFFLALTFGPDRRSVRRCREGRRIRRAHGPLAGNRQSGSDDRRHVGWHLHLDLSLFQRAPVEVVVLLHRDFHVAQAPS